MRQRVAPDKGQIRQHDQNGLSLWDLGGAKSQAVAHAQVSVGTGQGGESRRGDDICQRGIVWPNDHNRFWADGGHRLETSLDNTFPGCQPGKKFVIRAEAGGASGGKDYAASHP